MLLAQWSQQVIQPVPDVSGLESGASTDEATSEVLAEGERSLYWIVEEVDISVVSESAVARGLKLVALTLLWYILLRSRDKADFEESVMDRISREHQ